MKLNKPKKKLGGIQIRGTKVITPKTVYNRKKAKARLQVEIENGGNSKPS